MAKQSAPPRSSKQKPGARPKSGASKRPAAPTKSTSKSAPRSAAKAPAKSNARKGPAAAKPAKPVAAKAGGKSGPPSGKASGAGKAGASKGAAGKAAAPKGPPPKKKPEPPPPPPPVSMADLRAAASRLAAAAGLHPVRPAAKPAEAGPKVRRSNKTPLSQEEISHYKAVLMQKRSEIAGDVSTLETEALNSGGSGSLSHLPQHMADQGSDVYDQTLSLDLAASQRKLLIEIDQALERIAGGTYGVCSVLGIPIGKQRLDAKPWAKTSIEAARMAERGPMHA